MQYYPNEDVLLFPPSKLYSIVKDILQNKDPQLQKRLQIAIIIEDIPRQVHELITLSKTEIPFKINALIASLKEDYGETTAKEMVNYFYEAIRQQHPDLSQPPQKTPMQSIASTILSQPRKVSSVNSVSTNVSPALKSIDSIININQVGSLVKFGNFIWRILDIKNNQALLLSEHIIEKRCYHHSKINITWAECDLHDYLNSINKYNGAGFYDTFSSQDKAYILETLIDTTDSFYTKGGKATKDKIFLLSLEEVVKYFGDSGLLKDKKVKSKREYYDEYNKARKAYDETGHKIWWWLRSSGFSQYDTVNVDSDGIIYMHGIYVTIPSCGVRPALWINLPNVISKNPQAAKPLSTKSPNIASPSKIAPPKKPSV